MIIEKGEIVKTWRNYFDILAVNAEEGKQNRLYYTAKSYIEDPSFENVEKVNVNEEM